MIQLFIDWFGNVQGWLFQALIEPAIYSTGLGAYIEEAFEGTEWFLAGLQQKGFCFATLRDHPDYKKHP